MRIYLVTNHIGYLCSIWNLMLWKQFLTRRSSRRTEPIGGHMPGFVLENPSLSSLMVLLTNAVCLRLVYYVGISLWNSHSISLVSRMQEVPYEIPSVLILCIREIYVSLCVLFLMLLSTLNNSSECLFCYFKWNPLLRVILSHNKYFLTFWLFLFWLWFTSMGFYISFRFVWIVTSKKFHKWCGCGIGSLDQNAPYIFLQRILGLFSFSAHLDPPFFCGDQF